MKKKFRKGQKSPDEDNDDKHSIEEIVEKHIKKLGLTNSSLTAAANISSLTNSGNGEKVVILAPINAIEPIVGDKEKHNLTLSSEPIPPISSTAGPPLATSSLPSIQNDSSLTKN